MLLIFFIVFILLGSITAYRLLWPEKYVILNKPVFNFRWNRVRLRPEFEPQKIVVDALPEEAPHADIPLSHGIPKSGMDKMLKLETLLFEKNRIIDKLQLQLEQERSNRREFEIVKTIMDEEIARLREQLNAFRNYYKET